MPGDAALLVERLPSIHEALGWTWATTETRRDSAWLVL